jgi:hypothetical protein
MNLGGAHVGVLGSLLDLALRLQLLDRAPGAASVQREMKRDLRGHALRRLARRAAAAPGRALTVALAALALNRALAAYADSVHWARATPDDWITTAALSFTGAGIILHTGIGLRWPFTPKTTHDPRAIREYWPVLAPRGGGL